MVIFSPCKINIGLFVKNSRGDGYHNIETCFAKIPFFDIVEIVETQTTSFHFEGIKIDSTESENICVRAVDLVSKEFKIPPIEFYLLKNIPIGSGLGGGSADAVSTIELLDKLFDLKISFEKKLEFTSKLGADCPFFLFNQCMYGEDTGTVLSEIAIDLKDYYLLLCLPKNIQISTAQAFSNLVPFVRKKSLKELIANIPLKEWRNYGVENDFEKTIFQLHPTLSNIKNDLYEKGALYASMTGTGSCVYGIFDSKPIETEYKETNSCFSKILSFN